MKQYTISDNNTGVANEVVENIRNVIDDNKKLFIISPLVLDYMGNGFRFSLIESRNGFYRVKYFYDVKNKQFPIVHV